MRRITIAALLAVLILPAAAPAYPFQEGQQEERKIRARVQAHPGGPVEDIEMSIHEVPVDPKTVSADQVDFADDELVLGLVVDGKPIAYPVRYLAMFEVVNDRVGDTPLTPTW